ncbi:hypothetical protein [Streptomyces avicenniae]|uniref:hypothetical protein n=1 Tax=Streptomyces avicenniae TaxID=500153 RepID=UPI00069985DF|nr:hypothetical protein [Streptomyces avicenniae]
MSRPGQDDGSAMEQVSRLITQSRTAATDTVTEMQRVIDDGEEHADHGLTGVLEINRGAAEERWATWRKDAYPLGSDAPEGGLGVDFDGVKVAEVYGPEYAAPPALAHRIREFYLDDTALAAVTTQETLVEIVADYRHRLMDYGTQLADAGYDLSAGPMDLWTNEEMARYTAEQINTNGYDDAEALLRLLGPLQSLIDAARSGRTLTAAERDYMTGLLEGISGNTFARIARSEADGAQVYPGMPGWASLSGTERSPAGVLADAVMLLNDPARTGTDQDSVVLPEGLDLLRPRHDENGDALDPGAEDGLEYLRDHDDVALFLSQATIPPSDLMAREMADSALYTQELYIRHEEYRGSVPTSGANRLLETVARNPEASAGLLADRKFTDRLFDQQWENSAGAASLVTSGTTYPNDLPTDRRGESAYATARDHVTRVGTDDHDAVERGRGPIPRDVETDHDALMRAVDALVPRREEPLPD